MADDPTQDMNGGRSFEERIFARFDALDVRFNGMDARLDRVDARLASVNSAVRDLDSRVQRLEARGYDTKPIWEQALKEIVDTRRELSKRLDRIEAVVYGTRSDLRDLEDRVEKIEPKPIQ